MKAMVLGLGLAVVLAAIVGLSLALSPSGMQAQAQGASPAAPANVRSENGSAVGQQGYRIWIFLWSSCRYIGFQKPQCSCIRSRITNSVVALR